MFELIDNGDNAGVHWYAIKAPDGRSVTIVEGSSHYYVAYGRGVQTVDGFLAAQIAACELLGIMP